MPRLRQRLAKLSRKSDARKDAQIQGNRRMRRLITGIMLECLPGAALVQPEDCDPLTYSEIESMRAVMRGDWELADRLEAEQPKPPAAAIVPGDDPEEHHRESQKWFGAGGYYARRGQAQQQAVEKAKKRLGIAHLDGHATAEWARVHAVACSRPVR